MGRSVCNFVRPWLGEPELERAQRRTRLRSLWERSWKGRKVRHWQIRILSPQNRPADAFEVRQCSLCGLNGWLKSAYTQRDAGWICSYQLFCIRGVNIWGKYHDDNEHNDPRPRRRDAKARTMRQGPSRDKWVCRGWTWEMRMWDGVNWILTLDG